MVAGEYNLQQLFYLVFRVLFVPMVPERIVLPQGAIYV